MWLRHSLEAAFFTISSFKRKMRQPATTKGFALMIDFDLNERKVALDETTVRRLRAQAKAGTGSSSMLNDLAVLLGRARSAKASPSPCDRRKRACSSGCSIATRRR